jgi:uncharacterized membrane protein YkvA (DUF1232 family)
MIRAPLLYSATRTLPRLPKCRWSTGPEHHACDYQHQHDRTSDEQHPISIHRNLPQGQNQQRPVQGERAQLPSALIDSSNILQHVPWYAKLVAGMVAAYALSPIDLIPDFVPVVGYVDDQIIVPLGILLAIKLIPGSLLDEHRRAARAIDVRPVSRTAAFVIAALWVIASLALVAWLVVKFLR